MKSNLKVVCADIGSAARGNFGWWASSGESGTKLSDLADYVAKNLNDRIPVALGFECPLFIPLVDDEYQLTSARPGEGNRAWSAGAGCGALATGLVQVTWVLQEIRKKLIQKSEVPAFLSWKNFCDAPEGLFLWEAFISSSVKGQGHIDDAQKGAKAFLRSLPDPLSSNAIVCNSDVYSLAGAALLRTNWSATQSILSQPCLVIRPSGNET